MGLARLRLLVATALAGFAVAWLAYVKVYVPSGGRSIAWSEAVYTSRAVEPRFDAQTVSGEVLVVIELGPRSSTGYAVEITRVEEQRGRVLVVARERSPRLGDKTQPRVTFPALALTFRDVGKPVTLQWN
jgi:hypothetical protein